MQVLLSPVNGRHRRPSDHPIGYIALAEREARGWPKLSENPWLAGSTLISLALQKKFL
jgi:hypothetical protein